MNREHIEVLLKAAYYQAKHDEGLDLYHIVLMEPTKAVIVARQAGEEEAETWVADLT